MAQSKKLSLGAIPAMKVNQIPEGPSGPRSWSVRFTTTNPFFKGNWTRELYRNLLAWPLGRQSAIRSEKWIWLFLIGYCNVLNVKCEQRWNGTWRKFLKEWEYIKLLRFPFAKKYMERQAKKKETVHITRCAKNADKRHGSFAQSVP